MWYPNDAFFSKLELRPMPRLLPSKNQIPTLQLDGLLKGRCIQQQHYWADPFSDWRIFVVEQDNAFCDPLVLRESFKKSWSNHLILDIVRMWTWRGSIHPVPIRKLQCQVISIYLIPDELMSHDHLDASWSVTPASLANLQMSYLRTHVLQSHIACFYVICLALRLLADSISSIRPDYTTLQDSS